VRKKMANPYSQSIQRRCDKCNKATLVVNTKTTCQLYCTLRREPVSKYDQCDKFFYGTMDKGWVK
jgi:hypothetical protein